jgi:hypothetical protein
MKFAATTLALALALAASAVSAADRPASKAAQEPAKTLTPQQQKMKDCNAQAKGKKGAERNDFMKTCLKADGGDSAKTGGTVAVPPSAPTSQREKMKTCNADATTKGLKGDARKSYMSTCLKGDTAAAAAH